MNFLVLSFPSSIPSTITAASEQATSISMQSKHRPHTSIPHACKAPSPPPRSKASNTTEGGVGRWTGGASHLSMKNRAENREKEILQELTKTPTRPCPLVAAVAVFAGRRRRQGRVCLLPPMPCPLVTAAAEAACTQEHRRPLVASPTGRRRRVEQEGCAGRKAGRE